MKSLSFENRVSLTHKHEELMKTVEELSSCYAKREEFLLKNPHQHLFAMHTSEICGPGVCVLGIFIALLAGVAVVAVALVKVIPEAQFMMYDSQAAYYDSAEANVSIYRNIV